MDAATRLKLPSTSAATDVRSFYERRPYPPPLTSLDEHRDLYRDPGRRRAMFHLLWPDEPMRVDQQILVAGCGTSQAARYALREPEAAVIAIDVSETSLRYTRALQAKYGLQNLEVHRLAIEDVEALGRAFDQVVFTGVLHHLVDPDLGLRALRHVLRPHGAMHLMVYAPYGRAGVYMMQEYCRVLGIGTTDAELRDLCATLETLPGDHPIASLMRGARDFSQPDAVADALLHPVDRAYSVPELYDWLDRCGLAFGRWFHQAPYLPRCGMIAKAPHAARLAALPPRQQHAAVELFRGTMIRHNVIAYRDDRGERQPIEWAGDRWRRYVPIAMPSTVCVRDRVPPGAAAVLINRAHPFPDLLLHVDRFEDRLLAAIDGLRTLEEIVAAVAGQSADERRALTFFERLWQYDQIVCDASRVAVARGAASMNLQSVV